MKILFEDDLNYVSYTHLTLILECRFIAQIRPEALRCSHDVINRLATIRQLLVCQKNVAQTTWRVTRS